MDVRVGPQRRLSAEELMLSNCGAGEDTLELLGLHRDQASQSYRKSTSIFTGRIDTEAKTPILWPPEEKSQLIGKTLMLRKMEGRRRGDNTG